MLPEIINLPRQETLKQRCSDEMVVEDIHISAIYQPIVVFVGSDN